MANFVQIGEYAVNMDHVVTVQFAPAAVELVFDFAVALEDGPYFVSFTGEDRDAFLAWWENDAAGYRA